MKHLLKQRLAKPLTARLVLLLGLLAALGLISLAAKPLLAAKPMNAATGTVRVSVKDAPHGHYNIYLFKTGDAVRTRETDNVLISQNGMWVTFSNIPTGKRYFIRVKEVPGEGADCGGQCPDGYLGNGTLTLPDLHVIPDWN